MTEEPAKYQKDLPCPFCGSLDSHRVDESYYRGEGDELEHTIVECNNGYCSAACCRAHRKAEQ